MNELVQTEDFFDRLDMEGLAESKQELLECIQHCHRIYQLVRLLSVGFTTQIQKALEQIESHAARPVRISQQYVEEHFADKIRLEDVAEAVGLNPVYSVLSLKKKPDSISAHISAASAWKKRKSC